MYLRPRVIPHPFYLCLIVASFSIFVASPQVLAGDALPLTPPQINELIKTRGAEMAVDQLDQQGQYDDIMDKIGAGKSEWIALAPDLARGTDAGSSEELSISLALALPLNTEAVLHVMTTDHVSPLAVHAICSAPFIEDTVQDIPAYIKRSITAVQAVKDVTLHDQQKLCLTELQQAATQPTYNP